MVLAALGRPMRVAVVGAGVLGASTAAHLAGLGVRVTLVDPTGPGSGTSSRGAGLVGEGLSHPTSIRLATRSIEKLSALAQEGRDLGHPFRFFQVGGVTLVPPGLVEGARALAALQREHGADVREITPDEALALPRMQGADMAGVATAFHYPRDGWALPQMFARVCQRAILEAEGEVRRGAARLEVEGAVARVRVDGVRLDVDAVVIAAGMWTRGILRDAGLDAPLLAYRTQATRFLHPRGHDLPNVHDAALGWYMRPGPNGHLVAGNGTTTTPEDPSAWRHEPDEAFAPSIARRLAARFPRFADATLDSAWAGLDVATPDRLLLAGPHAGAEGLWLCAGGNGHGFMRAPAVGESLAAWIAGEKPRIPLDAYDPRRFTDPSQDFEIREGWSLQPPGFK